MRKRTNTLTIIFSLFAVLLLFSACEKKEEPSLPLLADDGTFLYSIIRPDTASGEVSQAALTLKKALGALSGLDTEKIALESDWIQNETDEEIRAKYEILIGKTNRAESTAALEGLGDESYLIRLSEDKKKIVLIGKDDEHTVMAVRAFLTDYLGYHYFAENEKTEGGIRLPMTFDETRTGTAVPIDFASGAILVNTPETFVADVKVTAENTALIRPETLTALPVFRKR